MLTDFDSVKNAMFKIKGSYDYILIHDAARPTTPNKLFEELIHFTKNKKYDCILPSYQVEDTLRKNKTSLDRKQVLAVIAEADILKKLDHPNILSFKDFFILKDHLCIVTDLLGMNGLTYVKDNFMDMSEKERKYIFY